MRTEYPGRDLSIVDVLNAGCSKGHALERWANYRGIAREQVMAIGDNYNDIEMLAFAGQPFIMGNASQELRGPRMALTRSNSESGVAAAIEFVLDGKAELEPASRWGNDRGQPVTFGGREVLDPARHEAKRMNQMAMGRVG